MLAGGAAAAAGMAAAVVMVMMVVVVMIVVVIVDMVMVMIVMMHIKISFIIFSYIISIQPYHVKTFLFHPPSGLADREKIGYNDTAITKGGVRHAQS